MKNEIELKDKKREKILNKINELNEKYFKDFLTNYNSFSEERDGLEKGIESKTVQQMLEKLNSDLDKLNSEIEETKNKILDLNKDIEKTDLEATKDTLKENLKEITDFEVKII